MSTSGGRRNEGLGVSEFLYMLGIQEEWIALQLGITVRTMRRDLRQLGIKNHKDRPTHKEVFPAVLKAYAQHNEEERVPYEKEMLGVWLGIELITSVFADLDVVMERLSEPVFLAQSQGYAQLLKAVFEDDENHSLKAEDAWKSYLWCIAQEQVPVPACRAELKKGFLEWYADECHGEVGPCPMEDVSDQIEKVLKALPGQQRKVIKMRFGLGRHKRTRPQVAAALAISASTVVSHETRALAALRQPANKAKLEPFWRICPVGELGRPVE